jgi:hypothetical protein
MAADIGFACEEMPFIHFTMGILMTIRHDDSAGVRFHLRGAHAVLGSCESVIWQTDPHHKQCFAKSPASLSEHFIRVEGNNVTKGENEGVDIFHVQVVGRDGVGDGVLSEDLRLFNGITRNLSVR